MPLIALFFLKKKIFNFILVFLKFNRLDKKFAFLNEKNENFKIKGQMDEINKVKNMLMEKFAFKIIYLFSFLLRTGKEGMKETEIEEGNK